MGRRQKQIRPTKVCQLAANNEDMGLHETAAGAISSANRKTLSENSAPPVEKKRSNFSISAQLGEGRKKAPGKIDAPISEDASSAKWSWQNFSSNPLQMFSSSFYPFLPTGFDYSAAFYPPTVAALLGGDAFSLTNYEALFRGMDSETQANYFSSILPYLQAAGYSVPTENCNGNSNGGDGVSRKRARSPTTTAKAPPAKKSTRHSTAANQCEHLNGKVVARTNAVGSSKATSDGVNYASNSSEALDLSVKGTTRNGASTSNARDRRSAPREKSSACGTSDEGNALNQLSSLVSSMSNKLSESPFKGLYSDFQSQSGTANFIDLYQHFLQSNGYGHCGKGGVEVDQSKIFTCLQCFQSFDSLQQLVKHMEKTQHFNSPRINHADNRTPSSASGKLNVHPIDKEASPSSSKQTRPRQTADDTKTNSKIQSSSNGRSGGSETAVATHSATYRFKCLLCDHSSDSSIDRHMTREHSFTSPNEWISAVKLIPL